MKRRPYGVNLDDGTALASDEEFGLLFVDARPEARAALHGWLADDEQDAILFGGQIGTGKTTLLNEVLRAYPGDAVVRMRFDTDCTDSTEGGYVLLMLGQVLKTCIAHAVPTDGCGLAIEDFTPLDCPGWAALAEVLTTPPTSLAEADRLRRFAAQVTPNGDHIRRACGELMDRLAQQLKRNPVLVADGVDKFALQTSDYDSLKKTLAFLAHRKTLFEVNAVHLFRDDDFRRGIRKLFIGGIEDDILQSVFAKRLGAYAPMYRQAFPLLTAYAGGNTRQGLRLLNAFYFLRTQKRTEHAEALARACHGVSSDILSVPVGRFPAEVLSAVRKAGYMEGSLPNDSDLRISADVNDALYRNWILIDRGPSPETPTQWPARLNPLLSNAFDWKPDRPLTAEEQAVRKWATEHGVSPLGLNAPVDERGEPDWMACRASLESSSSSKDEALNTVQLLEAIGAGLFGIERQDRIVVAYKNRANLDAVCDFLVGKANTYGFFPCREIVLTGGEGRQPIQELLVGLGDRDPNVIYSVDLDGPWTDAQLRDLEHRRDIFDTLQMLWWVQQDALEHYKPFWPQLRQLFRIYRLEEELWRGLTPVDIESDIAIIRSLFSQPDAEGVRRLQTVLAFLRERGAPA
jgi:hypothetical protein